MHQLVRKTLSFSKMLDKHIGAIWYFVHHYNANLKMLNHYNALLPKIDWRFAASDARVKFQRFYPDLNLS